MNVSVNVQANGLPAGDNFNIWWNSISEVNMNFPPCQFGTDYAFTCKDHTLHHTCSAVYQRLPAVYQRMPVRWHTVKG